MSAPVERTTEEWAALCTSQERTIQELNKEKFERGQAVNTMKNVVSGMGQLQEEQTADFLEQMIAAKAVIASLKIFKDQYEAVVGECHEIRDEAAFVEDNEKRLETLVRASKDAGRF